MTIHSKKKKKKKNYLTNNMQEKILGSCCHTSTVSNKRMSVLYASGCEIVPHFIREEGL